MGEFSMLCRECGEGITNTMRDDGWMTEVVAIMSDGEGIAGAYDGYGRVVRDGDVVTPRVPLDPFSDGDEYHRDAVLFNTYGPDRKPDKRGPTVYHFACWVKAGQPREYLGESDDDPNQGWSFSTSPGGPGSYPPCPVTPEAITAAWVALFDELYPPACDICGEPEAGGVCTWCGTRIDVGE